MTVSAALLERIRSEFLEMPGLKLSLEQACRLWNLKEAQCGDTLDALIVEGFLLRTPSGAFIAAPSAHRMAKAVVSEATRSVRCSHCQHLNSVSLDSIRGQSAVTTFRCAACAKLVSVASASA